MNQKVWYSTAELAGMPGMPATVQGVLGRAKAQNWPSRPRAGRGGGREYFLDALPTQTKESVRKPLRAKTKRFIAHVSPWRGLRREIGRLFIRFGRWLSC